jgi:hypothetical protein
MKDPITKVSEKLFTFWENEELFTFLYGEYWVRNREKQIASEAKFFKPADFIGKCRVIYLGKKALN